MSLPLQLDHYLHVRRSLGYDLGTSERVLRRFVRFAEDSRAAHIDTKLFLRWNASLPEAGPSTRSARLGMVRLFALWLSSIDPAHEPPPRGLLPDRSQRKQPYIYNEAEIAEIITAATQLPSVYGMRGLTCSTFFGLIAVTGLRISEALALDAQDLDEATGVLRVRGGKLGKERLLPLDHTVVARLLGYAAERYRLLGRKSDALLAILTDMSRTAATRASTCWKRHKAPMAAYWKATSVYARHIARAIRTISNAPDTQCNGEADTAPAVILCPSTGQASASPHVLRRLHLLGRHSIAWPGGPHRRCSGPSHHCRS